MADFNESTSRVLTIMAAPRLPLELLERIIDDVATDYVDNLSSIKACALVCYSFLPLCRKHIFASVTLKAYSSPTSDDLNNLLSNSPHLAVYIQKLVYRVNEKEFVAKKFSWLSPMFKKLVKLQKLSFSPSAGRKIDWMSSSVRKALLPLLHLPTLTSIRLLAFRNFALEDLAGCVNLKELEIGWLECSNDVGNFLETLPTTPPMLERLTINDGNIRPVQQLCHAQRPDGKPIIDFSLLRKITAEVARLDSMMELFGMCRNLYEIDLLSMSLTFLPLRSFDLTFIVQREIDPDPILSTTSLKGLFTMLKPSLPTLVNIYIRCSIEVNETDDGPLAGLCHELEKMVGQNVVETIELLIWVFPGCDCARWGELDDVLMGSPEGWPALRKVSLLFKVFDSDKTLRELPMTKLVESERVQFDFEVRVLQ